MKRITYISSITLLGLFSLSMISCNDFLTLYPLDRVVEENFWEDKNDLEGVRYGAYMQMSQTMEKFIAWGDLRSDAYKFNAENPNTSDYREIMLANPDSTMGCFDWGAVYTTINYCNKVLTNGEEVLSKDPQFTPTEWTQMKAEMTALRALNYFYLIRAFKDIPFTFDVINSDADVHAFSNTSQMDILNTLIDDVTAVAGQAKSRFPADKDTKGLITNTAIYALLAEMHLWRGALREGRGLEGVEDDAQKVIEFGQKSLDALTLQNEQITNSRYDSDSEKPETFNSGLTHDELIPNKKMESDYTGNDNAIEVNSFNAIFKKGNSQESIFEIQYDLSDGSGRNSDFMRSMWGYRSNKNFILAVSNEAVLAALNNDNEMMKSDCRTWYSCVDGNYMFTDATKKANDSKYYYCTKWMNGVFDKSSGNLNTDISNDISNTSYRNWIIYRKTDVMLMMAEAYAITGDFAKCRNIVDAVHKRSQLDQETGLSNDKADINKSKCIELVMRERLVELLGEGKRWFDLVRYAERIGGGKYQDPREPEYRDGSDGVEDMVKNFLAKGAYSQMKSNLISRMQNRYGLYSPIYYRERSANRYLIPQNPVWDREKGKKNSEKSETEE